MQAREAHKSTKVNVSLRTAIAWSQSLGCTWIKTCFVRVPSSDPRYADLPDPFTLLLGEAARLVLRAGGLEEELSSLQDEVPVLKREIESVRHREAFA